MPNSGGVKKASTDPDQVRQWWARWPQAMIALSTGKAIGAFVVDIDAGEDKKTGEIYEAAALQLELEKLIGERLPPTLFAHTPRGGVHLYFALPAEGPPPSNRANIIKRVDVRGDGGYVIAPPSPVDDSAAARLTGPRALHFVRKYGRIRNGQFEIVSHYWRGDETLGIKRSTYRVAPGGDKSE